MAQRAHDVQEHFIHCQALVRQADKDRFLASLFAPTDRRAFLFALYAFKIEIARVAAVVREALTGEIRLQWWREALQGERAGEARAHPVAAALMETIERFRLSVEPLLLMIDAHRRDLYEQPIATFSEFDDYADKTAAALIELAAKILTSQDVAAPAIPAGRAYAATALLTAFPRHAARRRLYIPLELLERHGLRPEEVFAGKGRPAIRAVLAQMRTYARRQLAAAAALSQAVPAAAVPAFLPVALIKPVLDRLDRQTDPFTPLELSPWRRQWMLWRAARRGIFG